MFVFFIPNALRSVTPTPSWALLCQSLFPLVAKKIKPPDPQAVGDSTTAI
jgi:hypothetical protein